MTTQMVLVLHMDHHVNIFGALWDHMVSWQLCQMHAHAIISLVIGRSHLLLLTTTVNLQAIQL